MKTGVFGGTFDPPHNGHLIVVEYARRALGLDRIILVPSYISPHKQDRSAAGPEHRLAMARLAAAERDWLEVSDCEIVRGGVSYTVDTLESLQKERPGHLFLLIGADNYPDMETWRDPERIIRLATLVVMTRPGSPGPTATGTPHDTIHLTVPAVRISSTDIRERVRNGQSIRYLVPPSVEAYLRGNRLYGQFTRSG